jgi:serine/threonine protein kinase/thioredoxin-like negative regulator of GroEL
MSRVYVARDTALGRDVVVKVLAPELAAEVSVERFTREIKVAARLQHPQIVPVFSAGDVGGVPFYMMPFIEGDSLRARLANGPLGFRETIEILRDVAKALAFAHGRGIAHRDIKPDNVLLTGGSAVVTDFGIAKAIETSHTQAVRGPTLTQLGVALGTPAYMAPEQAAADPDVDHRVDLYAFGCVAYEMLTGEPPFQGRNAAALFAAHLTQEPPLVAAKRDAVPAALVSLVSRCLQKDPAARPQTADEILATLDEASGELRHPSKPASFPTPTADTPSRIVVLPFANTSPDPDTEYFATGLTDELITDLSKIEALRVISRTSAMRFKGTTKTAATIAEELAVRYVVDGSVRKAGSAVRITAQLIDARTDTPLWADKFSGTDEDIFDLQERLSRQIADALRITLSPEESNRLAARPIADARAYDLYLRARNLAQRYSAPDLAAALGLLSEARRLIGDNEHVVGMMGQVYVGYAAWGLRDQTDYLEQAERCARSIFRQNPNSAQAHSLIGRILFRRADVAGSVHHLRRAAETDASDLMSRLFLAVSYLFSGATTPCRPIIERVLELDPLTPGGHCLLGWLHTIDGNADLGLVHYRHGFDLDPSHMLSRFLLGWSLAQAGHRAEAREVLEALGASGNDTVHHQSRAFACALAGDLAGVHAVVGGEYRHVAAHDPEIPVYLSEIFALVGDYDEAARWLRHAMNVGFICYPLTRRNPLYGNFLRDTRFLEIIEAMRARWEAFPV